MSDEIRPTVPLSEQFADGYAAMRQLNAAVRRAVDPTLLELIQLRASQINGCAYCLDMHTKDALANGERTDRLAVLPAWRESTLFTEQERAALALTEAVTRIADGHVPADVEARARAAFDEATYAAIVFAVVLINGWNRLAITGHYEPGHYQAGRPETARIGQTPAAARN
ncbi:MAG TPA: carboxymuconolactone decarboxylase family protein [Acidimicrobiales bacterium]